MVDWFPRQFACGDLWIVTTIRYYLYAFRVGCSVLVAQVLIYLVCGCGQVHILLFRFNWVRFDGCHIVCSYLLPSLNNRQRDVLSSWVRICRHSHRDGKTDSRWQCSLWGIAQLRRWQLNRWRSVNFCLLEEVTREFISGEWHHWNISNCLRLIEGKSG